MSAGDDRPDWARIQAALADDPLQIRIDEVKRGIVDVSTPDGACPAPVDALVEPIVASLGLAGHVLLRLLVRDRAGLRIAAPLDRPGRAVGWLHGVAVAPTMMRNEMPGDTSHPPFSPVLSRADADVAAAWSALEALVGSGELPAGRALDLLLAELTNRRPELCLIAGWARDLAGTYAEGRDPDAISTFVSQLVRALGASRRVVAVVRHAREIAASGDADAAGLARLPGPDQSRPSETVDALDRALAEAARADPALLRRWLLGLVDLVCPEEGRRPRLGEPLTRWVAILHFMLARRAEG